MSSQTSANYTSSLQEDSTSGPLIPGSSTATRGVASPSATTFIQPATTSGVVPIQDTTASSKHRDHTGAIVGGVIGGLAFFLLVTICAMLLRRRRRAQRTAPSAEFMGIVRGTTPGPAPTPAFARVEGSATPSGDRLLPLPLADDGHGHDDEEHPPLFTPGAYVDPVFEKVRAAAAMREEYEGRSSTAYGHEPEEESAASEVYEDCRSSTVYEEDGIEKGYGLDGEEKGYGVGGDEKFGEYAWAI